MNTESRILVWANGVLDINRNSLANYAIINFSKQWSCQDKQETVAILYRFRVNYACHKYDFLLLTSTYKVNSELQ